MCGSLDQKLNNYVIAKGGSSKRLHFDYRLHGGTRAQNIEFWPNGGHFRDDKKFPNFFQKKIYLFLFWLVDIVFNAYPKFQGK